MPHHEETFHIDAPVERVFGAMTNIAKWPEWWPEITAATIEGEWAAGTAMSIRALGQMLDGCVTAYLPNRELGFTTGLPLGGRVDQVFRFSSEDGGTKIDATMDASGVASMMFTRRRLLREMERFKAIVEAEA